MSYEDELIQRDQLQPCISTVCELGYHKLCSGVDAECACRCHEPEETEEEMEARAERAQQREIEDYYGGDGIGSYGPSDPKGR